jgi:hypothetical protein
MTEAAVDRVVQGACAQVFAELLAAVYLPPVWLAAEDSKALGRQVSARTGIERTRL